MIFNANCARYEVSYVAYLLRTIGGNGILLSANKLIINQVIDSWCRKISTTIELRKR